MHRARLLIAQTLSGIVFLFSVIYLLNFYNVSLSPFSVKGSALIALILSIVAYITSLKLRSPVVAVFLILGGILVQIPPVLAIIAERAIEYPGPILGIIFFSPILGLGIAKAVMINRSNHAREREAVNTTSNLSSESGPF